MGFHQLLANAFILASIVRVKWNIVYIEDGWNIFDSIVVPPMMWIPAQQTSAISGNSITLTCFVEAHPEALTFWEHNGRMIQSDRRVYMTNKPGTPKYKVATLDSS